jgi:hypothetical protein
MTRRTLTAAAALALVVAGVALAACSIGEPARPSLVFSPATLPAAQTGQVYETSITVSGNVTPVGSIFAEGKLPPGLHLTHVRANSSAAIEGTPTAAGSYPFTIGAWCLGTNITGQEGRQAYVIVVR